MVLEVEFYSFQPVEVVVWLFQLLDMVALLFRMIASTSWPYLIKRFFDQTIIAKFTCSHAKFTCLMSILAISLILLNNAFNTGKEGL